MLEERLFEQHHAVRPLDALEAALDAPPAPRDDRPRPNTPASRSSSRWACRAPRRCRRNRARNARRASRPRAPRATPRAPRRSAPRRPRRAANGASGEEASAHRRRRSPSTRWCRALAPQRVDAVVPVAGAEQRQAVGAEMAQRIVDRRGGNARRRRRSRATGAARSPGVLALGHRRPFEIGHVLVEHAASPVAAT